MALDEDLIYSNLVSSIHKVAILGFLTASFVAPCDEINTGSDLGGRWYRNVRTISIWVSYRQEQ